MQHENIYKMEILHAIHYQIYNFSGSPRDYLEAYIFPVLLPALEEMLKQAKVEKCFEVNVIKSPEVGTSIHVTLVIKN